MSFITLYLPKMGESVMEAVVLDWHIKEGEIVSEGMPLLEVATDKVDAEIPAAYSGTIRKLLVSKGEVISIGAPIALLELDELKHEVRPSITYEKPCLTLTPNLPPIPISPAHPAPNSFVVESSNKVKLTPLANHAIKEHTIEIEKDELAKLGPYTKNNRITKKLILDYLVKRLPVHTNAPDKPLAYQGITPLEGDEVIEMDRVRKLIANRMVQSKQIAPHVTSFIRADVTDLVNWRMEHKKFFEQEYGIKLSYTPIFMTVIARALQLFPLLNAVVLDDKIIKRKHINIGFAVALPNGNLLVPVIKQVEQLALVPLTQQIDDLINKARSGTITADALNGASYTISNIGSFDNLMGTPIIVQPQVAILALGLIEKRPAVIYVDGKETIAIRNELFLSHTYDHRIIDGAIGGGFLKCLAKTLASFVDNIKTYPFT